MINVSSVIQDFCNNTSSPLLFSCVLSAVKRPSRYRMIGENQRMLLSMPQCHTTSPLQGEDVLTASPLGAVVAPGPPPSGDTQHSSWGGLLVRAEPPLNACQTTHAAKTMVFDEWLGFIVCKVLIPESTCVQCTVVLCIKVFLHLSSQGYLIVR